MPILPYQESKEQYPYRVTQKLRSAFAMGDQPTEQLGGWIGYFHQQDPTTYPEGKDNLLTYPSINCFIPFRDKIVPKLGTTLLGAPFTEDKDWGCIGHMKKYGTMSGIETEIRVTQSGDANLRDILKIWCPDFINGVRQSTYSWKQITLNNNPLPFGTHEYYFDQWFDTDLNPAQALNLSRAIWTNGTTNIYSWTGGIAPIVSIVPGISISTVSGVSWESQGFVDPAFDNSLNGTITINGEAYTVLGGWETDTLRLASTTGISVNDVAFSQIQSVPTPVNISGIIAHGTVTLVPATGGITFQPGEEIIGGTSGATAFITSDVGGFMILYGIKQGTGGYFQTNEIITGVTSKAFTTVASFTETSYNQLVFDMCRNNLGYMYYGSWNTMKVYQSNQFNKSPTEYITNSQAIQNDLVIGTTDYTGTGQNVYRVTIDSVFPIDNTQSYIPTGNSQGLNDGLFDTTCYIASPNFIKPNIYRINVMADATLVFSTSLSPTFVPGETVYGTLSAAEGIVIAVITNAGKTNLGVQMTTSNMFQYNEPVIGSTTTTGGTLIQAQYQNWVQYINSQNVVVNINTGIGSLPISPINSVNSFTLTDGLTFKFANFRGHSVGDSFQLSINQGGYDTFKWQINGGNPVQTGVIIPSGTGTLVHGTITGGAGFFFQNEKIVGMTSGSTGFMTTDISGTMTLYNTSGIFEDTEIIKGISSLAQATVSSYLSNGVTQFLNNGISLSFSVNTGHTLGDFWDITATQGVGGINPSLQNPPAYANFYYTLPARIPGEGYIYSLTANFWTIAPQESQMYVCNSYGEWSYITVGGQATSGGTGIKISGNGSATSAPNVSEPISITPLKQTSAMKPIYPYMIGYMADDLIFVTTNKILGMLGRRQLIQLPRIDTLSHPVQLDFNATSFKNGSFEYFDERLWINSPTEGVMFCYDNHKENNYWQPPQMIPENGILSVINTNGKDVLISHSQLRDQSWNLFDGHNGDNGNEYLVQAQSPYLSKGDRWGIKAANKTFCEGYVEGKPPMVQTLIKEVNGCGGTIPHDIKPVVCVADTTAPFGKGNFGSHPNGSDFFIQNNYFREEYPYQQTQNFYFAAIRMSCLTTNHSYEWLTFGVNSVVGNRSNIDFMNKKEILKN